MVSGSFDTSDPHMKKPRIRNVRARSNDFHVKQICQSALTNSNANYKLLRR